MRKKRYSRREIVAFLKAAGNGPSSVWLFRKPGASEGSFVPWRKKASGPEIGPTRSGAEA